MKNNLLFDYPNNLNKIFDKLNINGIKSIIIGGYVRDFFLNISSKDIDIELYGVNSFEELENILQEFGSVNNVGKSFGVCKLTLKNIEIDFTLPRRDNKIGLGHRGFLIQTDKNLDFICASKRRDFTMNAIGYDIQTKKFIDPFNGLDAINNKLIKAVDLETFAQDPLRVFRAVTFASRLNFTIEEKLFSLCKNMCEKNILYELAPERIYEEVKKIFFKSHAPSVAFILLKKMNALKYLHPLDTLSHNNFVSTMQAIDKLKLLLDDEHKSNIFLFLSVMCYKLNKNELEIFIGNLTNKKQLSSNIYQVISTPFVNIYTNSQLLHLATKVNIELFLLFNQAVYPKIDTSIFLNLKTRAIKLNVLNTQQEEILKGRDIEALGIKPSKEYATILHIAYKKQLNLEILDHKEAIQWLKKYLFS